MLSHQESKKTRYKRRVAPDAPEVPEAILLECGHAGGLMLPSLPSVWCGLGPPDGLASRWETTAVLKSSGF